MKNIWLATGLLILIAWPRITDLGTVITNDENIWQGRAHRYITGFATLDVPMLFSGGQPGVTTMFFAGLADQFHSFAASQAAIAIAVSILLGINIVLLARLAGWPLALLAGLLLALDPFFIAHSRVVHTDALLASFMLLSLLLLALAWREKSLRYLYFSTVAVALSILTKFFAAWFLIPLAWVTLRGQFGGRKGRTVMAIVGVFLAVVVVLWPVVLAPAEPLSIILKYSGLSLSTSEYGKGADQPLYYMREWWFRITPLAAIAAPVAVAGLIAGGRRGLPNFPSRKLMWWLLGSAVFYGVILSLSEQKADRYFLIGFVVTNILSAAGIMWLAALLRQLLPDWNWQKAALPAGLILAGGLAWDVVAMHPYYLVYYNPWAPAETTRKLGWGEGLEQAALWLTSHPEGEEEAEKLPKVASHYIFAMREHYRGPLDSLGHEYDTNDFRYVVLYRTMFERGLEHEQTQYLKAYFSRGECVWQLTANGLPHVWIFERLPQKEKPGPQDNIRSYSDISQLPQCVEEQIIADPKARWML